MIADSSLPLHRPCMTLRLDARGTTQCVCLLGLRLAHFSQPIFPFMPSHKPTRVCLLFAFGVYISFAVQLLWRTPPNPDPLLKKLRQPNRTHFFEFNALLCFFNSLMPVNISTFIFIHFPPNLQPSIRDHFPVPRRPWPLWCIARMLRNGHVG